MNSFDVFVIKGFTVLDEERNSQSAEVCQTVEPNHSLSGEPESAICPWEYPYPCKPREPKPFRELYWGATPRDPGAWKPEVSEPEP